MSAAFPTERRVRRADLWFAVLFLTGFAILIAVEVGILMQMRNETYQHMQRSYQHMQRVETVLAGLVLPSDVPKILDLLKAQDGQVEQLTNLAAQQAVVVKAIKARQDRRGKMISTLEKEVSKMKAKERGALRIEIEQKREAQKGIPKLGPRK